MLTQVDDSGKFMGVPIGTVKSRPDTSCLLEAGDHEFIVHQSYVLYRYTRLFDHGPIWAQIRQGSIDHLTPFSEEVFRRVCAGMRASMFAQGWAKKKLGHPR